MLNVAEDKSRRAASSVIFCNSEYNVEIIVIPAWKVLVCAVCLNLRSCIEQSVTMAAERRRVRNTGGSITVLHSRWAGKNYNHAPWWSENRRIYVDAALLPPYVSTSAILGEASLPCTQIQVDVTTVGFLNKRHCRLRQIVFFFMNCYYTIYINSLDLIMAVNETHSFTYCF